MICPYGHTNEGMVSYCTQCGASLRDQFAHNKNPWLALFFALFFPVGVGQFYNGDFKRGILVIILFFFSLAIAIPTASLSVLAVVLWGAINAYNVAAKRTPLWT